MSILKRFAPPANLTDLDSIPGALEFWHAFVSNSFDTSIKTEARKMAVGPFQFYNPARFDPGGVVIEQDVTWNAFPKELLRRFGREDALKEADQLWTLDRYYSVLGHRPVNRKHYKELFSTRFRPQTEYCEWRVERDKYTRDIRRVIFTCEPPEYWQIFFYWKPGPTGPAG